MFRKLAAVGCVVVVAVLVLGCGKADRVEYERDLAKVGRVVDRSLEQLPEDDSATIGSEDVRRIAGDLREAADQLEDLSPPDDAVDAQARLERGLRGVADAFEQLADDLDASTTDTQKAELFVRFASSQDVEAAFDDLVGAQEAYADDGYRVFGRSTVEPAPTTTQES